MPSGPDTYLAAAAAVDVLTGYSQGTHRGLTGDSQGTHRVLTGYSQVAEELRGRAVVDVDKRRRLARVEDRVAAACVAARGAAASQRPHADERGARRLFVRLVRDQRAAWRGVASQAASQQRAVSARSENAASGAGRGGAGPARRGEKAHAA